MSIIISLTVEDLSTRRKEVARRLKLKKEKNKRLMHKAAKDLSMPELMQSLGLKAVSAAKAAAKAKAKAKAKPVAKAKAHAGGAAAANAAVVADVGVADAGAADEMAAAADAEAAVDGGNA
jgi:hypothetical protein